MSNPKPTKANLLSRLAANIPISSIVDVGVRECTGELIVGFPDKKHYLFEPVSLFFADIQNNYKKIDYELFPFALANEDSRIYLVLTSLNRDGKVTHSRISTEPVVVDGYQTVSCEPIEVRRFESLPLAQTIAPDFLLKIDVDGQDLNVAKGFSNKLRLASAVVIECTFGNAIERIGYLQDQGFSLVDMVDFVYYGPSLYQFDAVVVRNDLITEGLRPPINNFKLEYWTPLKIA